MARRRRKKRWLDKKDNRTVGFVLGAVFLIATCYSPIIQAVAAPTPTNAGPATVERVLEIAESQVGTKESPPGSNKQKYGEAYGQNGVAWCAIFVWWLFIQANAKAGLPEKTASVYELQKAFKRNGQFYSTPEVGDIVIYDFGDGHTGIVKSVQPTTIHAIEGNTSGSAKGSQSNGGVVAEKVRPRDNHILGYGRPGYEHLINFGPLSSKYNALFEKEGTEHGVSPILLAAMAKQESGFNPKAGSKAGAMGLMQFTAPTAKGLGIDPWVPEQAVDGAARSMAERINEYNGSTDLALASYNAGSGAVKQYGGVPPYRETQNYIRNINAMVKQAS